MTKRLLSPLAGAALLAGCAATTTPPPAARPSELSTVGMHRVPLIVSGQNALLAEVTIRGEPVLMLVDTGAQSTVLDIGVARRLGLTLKPGASYAVGIGAGRVAGREAEATTFTLAGFDTTIAARVQDFTGLTWNGLARSSRPVVGLLGFDVLRSYGAIVDVSRGEMWLRRSR